MSTELPANDFPFLNRLLAEIKLLRETKRPRRSSALKSESLPSPAKRECGGRANGLQRPARQAKATMANDLFHESR
jgi:hypothetical protein